MCCIVTAKNYRKLKGPPAETEGLYCPKYTYDLKNVTKLMMCVEWRGAGNHCIRAHFLKPHGAYHTPRPTSVNGERIKTLVKCRATDGSHFRPSQLMNRSFAHECANVNNGVGQHFMSVPGNAKAGTANVLFNLIGCGRSQTSPCWCRFQTDLSPQQICSTWFECKSKRRASRNEQSRNFRRRIEMDPSAFGVLNTAGHNVVSSETPEVAFESAPNAVSTFILSTTAATSSNEDPICERSKEASTSQIEGVTTTLNNTTSPALRLHTDALQRLQSLLKRRYREKIQKIPEIAKSDLFRDVSLEELVGKIPECDIHMRNTVDRDTTALRFPSFGRPNEKKSTNVTCSAKAKPMIVSSYPERESNRLPKRLLKMGEFKCGNNFELSTGRTFARGFAGCDVVATQLVATRSEFVKYDSTCEAEDGLGTSLSSRFLAPVTDLQPCHTPESKSAFPSQSNVEVRPNADEMCPADPLRMCMGCTIATSPQVITTHQTISGRVQTDLTEHSFVTHQLQLSRFCTLNALLNSGDMCSQRQRDELPLQEPVNVSKFFQNVLEDQPNYVKVWGSGQMEKQVEHSVHSTVTSMARVNYTPRCSEALQHRSALRALSSSDVHRELSSSTTFMPSYVRRTDSWSYWPCAAPFAVPTAENLGKQYTLEETSLLGKPDRTGLKLFRRGRACNPARSPVASSCVSKHESSSEGEETLEDTGSTELSDMSVPKGFIRPEASPSIRVPPTGEVEGLRITKLQGDPASYAASEQEETSSVLQRDESTRPKCNDERPHPLLPASHSCRSRRPHLVRQHRVVDITIDSGYHPSRWPVESEDDLRSVYLRPDGNRMWLRPLEPTNDNVFTNGAVGSAASTPVLPTGKRMSKKFSTIGVNQLRRNLGLQAVTSKTVQRTTGERYLNTPLQPMVPLKCRKCESPKVRAYYLSKGCRDSSKSRQSTRPRSVSTCASPMSHTLNMANEIPHACKSHRGASHSGACTPIYGGRCSRQTTQHSDVANIYPIKGDLMTHCVSTTKSCAPSGKIQSRKSGQRPIRKQTGISSSDGVGALDLQKLIQMYIVDSISSQNIDGFSDFGAKRPRFPGWALGHLCQRYLRTFSARPRSSEIKGLGTLPFVRKSSHYHKRSAPPDSLRVSTSCPGKNFSGSISAAHLFARGGTQDAEISEVSMESQKDTVMFSRRPSPKPYPGKMADRSEPEQSGLASLDSVNQSFTDYGALDDASSSQLRAVDQRIGEALHGTLERILFDSADQLVSLATSTQSSRSLKLVSRLDFIEDIADDSTIHSRQPCVIRSYEFVHKTPHTSSGDEKSRTILVNRQPVVIGTRDSEDTSSSLLKQRAGSKLWCCAGRTKEHRAASR